MAVAASGLPPDRSHPCRGHHSCPAGSSAGAAGAVAEARVTPGRDADREASTARAATQRKYRPRAATNRRPAEIFTRRSSCQALATSAGLILGQDQPGPQGRREVEDVVEIRTRVGGRLLQVPGG